MKAQLFAVVLAVVCLSVYGIPTKAKYNDCGNCEGEYTVTETVSDPVTEEEETVTSTEGYAEENLQQHTQTETVQDNITEPSNLEETITEKEEPVAPEIAPEVVPEIAPVETPVETPIETPVETPVEAPVEPKVETPLEPPAEAPVTVAPTTEAQPKPDVVNKPVQPVTKKTKKNRPSFNFFPVVFGGTGISGGRSDGFPTGTVAVANSFSTGRNSVAVSHANAGPADAFRHLYRNQNSRYTYY